MNSLVQPDLVQVIQAERVARVAAPRLHLPPRLRLRRLRRSSRRPVTSVATVR